MYCSSFEIEIFSSCVTFGSMDISSVPKIGSRAKISLEEDFLHVMVILIIFQRVFCLHILN